MRVDAKKNLQKVATELIKDPLQSGRDIADKTGICKSTVYSKLDEVGRIDKNDAIIKIAEHDLEDLKLIQALERSSIKKYEDLKPSDLNAVSMIGERKQKRYSILMGETTDDKGGDKHVIYLPQKDDRMDATSKTETST